MQMDVTNLKDLVDNVVPGQMDMEGNVHETKKTKIFEGNDTQKIIQFK